MTGESATLQAAALALDAAFVARANAGDAAGLVDAYYAGDAVLLPPGHPPIHGKAAMVPFWEGLMSALVSVTLETTIVEGDGRTGYGVGTASLAMRGPDGAPVHDTAKYLLAYRRQADGGWKVVADMWNTNA